MNINSLCKSRIHSYLFNGERQVLVIKKFLHLAVIKNCGESYQVVLDLFAVDNLVHFLCYNSQAYRTLGFNLAAFDLRSICPKPISRDIGAHNYYYCYSLVVFTFISGIYTYTP